MRLPLAPTQVDPEAPECTECGRCCHNTDTHYVMLFQDDIDRLVARLGERFSALTLEYAGRVFMRFEGGHCVALQTGDGRFTCAIYEDRPRLRN